MRPKIKFELEGSDIECDFTPDFDLSVNCIDIEEVKWNLQDGNHSGAVANVLGCSSEHEHSSTHLLPTL